MIAGLHYVTDYLDRAQHNELLDTVSVLDWRDVGGRRIQFSMATGTSRREGASTASGEARQYWQRGIPARTADDWQGHCCPDRGAFR